MGPNGRNMMRDDQDWNRDRDREFEDRSEGSRWGDHPQHDRNMQMQRDRYAMGQSGYSSGRSGQDPSLNYQNRNSGYSRGTPEDRQTFGTDDRFTGRQGGGDYARDRGRSYDPERMGVQGGYGGGRGWEAERIGQRDSYGDRNYDRSFGSRDTIDDQRMGRGMYDHRDDNRSFQSRDYGPSEGERGIWSTANQRGQGQHRGKGPRGFARSDERIKETVCEALSDDEHIDASSIDVEVKSGEVTLSGTVPDRRIKRAAEDLVENLSGVKDVSNQLKVSEEDRKIGRAVPGNQAGNGMVQHEESRKGDDKKARA